MMPGFLSGITASAFPSRSFHTVGDSVTKQTEKLRAILTDWRRPVMPEDVDDVSVASVSSPCRGFLAAVSVGAEPNLVVALASRLSTDLDSQIIASGLSNGLEIKTNPQECEDALEQIRKWAGRESAAALAGLTDSSVLCRRRIVNRIDRAIESAPPHSRSRRLQLAAKARRVAAAQHGSAIEAELESLSGNPVSDDDWLASVARLESAGSASPPTGDTRRLEIHALLLMRRDSSKRVQ